MRARPHACARAHTHRGIVRLQPTITKYQYYVNYKSKTSSLVLLNIYSDLHSSLNGTCMLQCADTTLISENLTSIHLKINSNTPQFL